MHRNTRRSANTATSFLDPWIGTLYNGLNSIRLTAVTDTPLRLRQVLNNAAQAKANSLCAGGSQQKLELSNFGVDAENAQTLVLQNQQSANDAVDMWAKAKLGKDSPLTDALDADTYYDFMYSLTELRMFQGPNVKPLWTTPEANKKALQLAQVASALNANATLNLPLSIDTIYGSANNRATALYAVGSDIASAIQSWTEGCPKCKNALISPEFNLVGLANLGNYWTTFLTN
ncbi:hypothetical protein J3B02_003294 [Coemansia erecta]|uniref:Uncharacterized protein n=1 Tax=Coemansia asiatica TaxID=1052880 RepID=A0A9W8CGW0_9FUNG|nr:hypothetical protein LPJ64_006242 [Coemansia asiatica]KAJ2853095.1 hypothetical protein J3B02_003294 [Coemansia erecta]